MGYVQCLLITEQFINLNLSQKHTESSSPEKSSPEKARSYVPINSHDIRMNKETLVQNRLYFVPITKYG